VVIKHLSPIAKKISRLHIPKEVGKDVTDWLKNRPVMRKRHVFEIAMRKAEPTLENPTSYVERAQAVQVPLDQASRAEHFHKPLLVDALVTGKDIAPFILPRTCRVTCSKKCDECPLAESAKPFKEVKFEPNDPSVLGMVDSTSGSVNRTIVGRAGFPFKDKCRHKVEIIDTFNLESVMLIPTLDDKDSQYVMRPAYLVGHGLHSNRSYRFSGTTTAHPETQQAVHLFSNAVPVQGQVETFELTDELKQKLRRFQLKGSTTPGRIIRHLHNLAGWQSRHITKIIRREDLHITVDLVFHSVSSMRFNNELIKRAMLDVLIIGDTRCGKGYVTEGLVRYYKLGEVASGENCSFAGLVGGCESVGKRFIVKWGIIPLNNGRLVVIDEASSLTEESFGAMSRVRSEGVAEISKIVREQTQANTRLLWLSNPRSGRPITSYNAGVQAAKELVGANEDISRFDFAMTVAGNEVPADAINMTRFEDDGDKDRYPAELCRSLVLWAWSRSVEQIKFTDEATSCVLDQALILGRKYSSQIPLVQAENIRIKIAKISAALAARLFNTDDGCENLIIDTPHVLAACEFLQSCYDKPSMAYNTLSASLNERGTISDMAQLAKIFENLSDMRMKAIHGLMNLHHITADTLSDYLGDMFTAKSLLSDLVQLGCINRYEKGNWYLKTHPFITWLREQKQ